MELKSHILSYARSHAELLTRDMSWKSRDLSGGWWAADSPEKLFLIVARATAAVEFLRQYAGAESQWRIRAEEVFRENGDRQSKESGARAVGEFLLGWADQVDAGIVQIVGTHGLSEISVAETDLLGQVRQLLEDDQVHPAAPIMLCGAALEISARGVCDDLGLQLGTRPSLMAWANRLREDQRISKRTLQEFELCAGLRNDAAHGRFEDLSRERAKLMEQQAALLLAQLAGLLARPPVEA